VSINYSTVDEGQYTISRWVHVGTRSGELYPCETDERLCEQLETGAEVEVDLEADRLTDLATGRTFSLKPLGEVRFGHATGAALTRPVDNGRQSSDFARSCPSSLFGLAACFRVILRNKGIHAACA